MGVGEAAINSDARLQQALAAAGFVFDPTTGTVTNLKAQARAMSKRAVQIQGNAAQFEQEWRTRNPGVEPDAGVRREWDQKAWSFQRPRKRQQTGSAEAKWVGELRGERLQVDGFTPLTPRSVVSLEQLDRSAIAEHVVAVAGAKASAWSLADLEGHIGVAVGKQRQR